MSNTNIFVRFFKSIINNVTDLIANHMLIPLCVTLVAVGIFAIFCIIKKRDFVKRQFLSLSVSIFYFALLFDITLVGRVGEHTDPLSNVFGDWFVWQTDLTFYVNLSPVINLIMTMPIAFAVYYVFKSFGKVIDINRKFYVVITLISFFISLIIECTQLVFSIGTFQISDLVYNTLGGFIGTTVLSKIIKKHST